MKAVKNLTYRSGTEKEVSKVIVCEENIWLTQMQMSRLFGCSVQEVYAVLKRLFQSGELENSKVNRTIEVESSTGHLVSGNFYNLDAVTAVGYRLNARETTLFHIWSMQMLKNHLLGDMETTEYGIIEGLKRKISHMLAVA